MRNLPTDYAMFTKYMVELSRLMTLETNLTSMERDMMHREKQKVEDLLRYIESEMKQPRSDWGGETGY
jgi:uncharacterized protein YukE